MEDREEKNRCKTGRKKVSRKERKKKEQWRVECGGRKSEDDGSGKE